MALKDLFYGKKSESVKDVPASNTIDSDDVHKKYAKAIEPVLLRELGNTPRMRHVHDRIMIAIKSV